MKQYWLTLNHETFLWVNRDKGCVYNTRNYRLFQFDCTNRIIRQSVDALLQIDNLYRIVINEEELASPEVKEWVDGLLKIEASQLLEDNGINQKPVSLLPKLKMSESMLAYGLNQEESGKIMMHLHELIFYINGSKFGNDNYYKQITYPTQVPTELKAEDIIRFIGNAGEVAPSLNITLVGCPWEYSGCEQLFDYLNSLVVHVSIYCTEKDYLTYNTDNVSLWNSDLISFHILVSDYEQADNGLFRQSVQKGNIHYGFVVTSEEDTERATSLIERYGLKQYRFYPVYTGDNLSYFEDALYMTKEDLDALYLSKRKIFAHQMLNTNYFGVLAITSDGLVYPGEIQNHIGTIQNSPFSIVYKEITQGKSWLYIRGQGACENCIYRYLCPSPSPYERVINRPDLCHINKE